MAKNEHTQIPWEVETPMGDETPWVVEAGLEAYQWRCIAMTCSDGSDEGHDALTIEDAANNAAFIVKACNAHADLVKALEASCGYLVNAAIDLQSGCTKATAIKTINGGVKMVREALEKVKS